MLKKHRKNFLTGKICKGITNIQIETALNNINDPDTDDNFVGVFPANNMNRFIDYKSLISEKKGKYPFIIANKDSSDKAGMHWWSMLDIEPRTDLFFLILLVSMVLKASQYRTIKRQLKKYCLGQNS